jgi:hypothetical protein
MLSLKTTIAALIAALSVLATVSVGSALIPQAFAQNVMDDDEGNTVDATQSNSFTANIGQSQTQSSGAAIDVMTDDDDDGTDTTQTANQGFCLQANQQNAAAGDDATNTGANAIAADNESVVDCS